MDLEDRINAANARLSNRMAELDARISSRFGAVRPSTPSRACPGAARTARSAPEMVLRGAVAASRGCNSVFDLLHLERNPFLDGDFVGAVEELERELRGLGIDPDELVVLSTTDLDEMEGMPDGFARYFHLMEALAFLDSVIFGDNGTSRSGAMRYGVFVGVNHSPAGNPLKGCVNDANDLRDACVDLGGWLRQNTVVLEDATGSAFLESISRFAAVARPGDVVVVSFSGHGAAFGTNPENDFVFAMSDGFVEEKDFRKALAAFSPGVKVVVLVDACFSGAAADAGLFGRHRLPNVGWITASTSWQTSDDAFQGNRHNGFLTGALLEGWRKGGAAGMAAHAKAVPFSGAEDPAAVSFLDLAVFAANSWRYWHPSCQQPQYQNPGLLASVVAGRNGATSRSGRDSGKTTGDKNMNDRPRNFANTLDLDSAARATPSAPRSAADQARTADSVRRAASSGTALSRLLKAALGRGAAPKGATREYKEYIDCSFGTIQG